MFAIESEKKTYLLAPFVERTIPSLLPSPVEARAKRLKDANRQRSQVYTAASRVLRSHPSLYAKLNKWAIDSYHFSAELYPFVMPGTELEYDVVQSLDHLWRQLSSYAASDDVSALIHVCKEIEYEMAELYDTLLLEDLEISCLLRRLLVSHARSYRENFAFLSGFSPELALQTV